MQREKKQNQKQNNGRQKDLGHRKDNASLVRNFLVCGKVVFCM